MAAPRAAPVDNLTGRLEGMSIGSGGGGGGGAWRSPASAQSAPASSSSDHLISRGHHTRQYPQSPSLHENGVSRPSIHNNGGDTDASGSTGGGADSLSKEQREAMRASMVRRKKDFRHMEKVKGRTINILEGLELHTGVFSAEEQKKIVDCVYDLQERGRNKKLRARTYSEPRKWMRGKGRITMQFGCCYNYAVDKDGNPPGIVRDEEVDPIPPSLKSMIKRMVGWNVLPGNCVPDSCIINIYEKDDCIPPHIDHHDFLRPFCTVSFLTECDILFGTELKVLGPGEFQGSVAIPLPLGSVLVLKGNGADVARHCVPAVPAKRISITFRKMDAGKLPFGFSPDPELHNLRPTLISSSGSPAQQARTHASVGLSTPPVLQHQQNSGVQSARTHASVGPSTPPIPQHQQNLGIQSARQALFPQQRSWHNTPVDQQQKRDNSSGPRVSEQPSSGPFKLDDDFPPLGSSNSNGKTIKSSRPLRQ